MAAVPPDGWLCWEYEKRWYPGAAELPGQLARGREYLESLVATATATATAPQAE